MAKLTKAQLAFLEQHEIPLSRVFDAAGLSAKEWKSAMKDLDMWVAVGGARCAAGRHQMRSRNSDCLQCRPAVIGYIKRYFQAGHVYVSQSRSAKIIKVGSALDPAFRVTQLNCYQYGGAFDWTLEYAQSCPRAGEAEFVAHRLLIRSVHTGTYIKNGTVKECRELFRCSLPIAIKSVQRAIDSIERRVAIVHPCP